MEERGHELKRKDKKEFLPQDHIEKGQDGWLSPKGEFFPCATTEHDDCARFITSEDAKNEEFTERRNQNWRIDYDDKPARSKLEMAGFVLVRGDILPTEKLGNLEPEQLKILGDAEIRLVDPIDNESCSVEMVQKIANDLREKIQKIKKSEPYLKGLKKIEEIYARNGISTKDLLDRGKIKNLFDMDGVYLGENFIFDTLLDIENYEVSPLTRRISVNEYFSVNGDHEIMVNTIFDTLSEGYTEGLAVDNGRFLYFYRLIPTEEKGIYVMIEKTEYRHDGQTGGLTGDFNYHVNAKLVTKFTLRERLNKLRSGEKHEVTFEKQRNMFDFIESHK